MITRTIYIGNPAYLKLKDMQMKIICPETKNEKGSVPIEDLGVLMLDHPQVTISHQLIQRLMQHQVVLISCDPSHMPHGIMLPLYGHSEYSQRSRVQLDVSEPLKKQLWKQTVEAKIYNQSKVLKNYGLDEKPLQEYYNNIKTGDSSNMEGIAAQYYWRRLIHPEFIRSRFGELPNAFFNFGYIVLRSMVARSIVETGLIPVLGIFHKNKYNPYCLADDLMEPYRPFVDLLVMEWLKSHPDSEFLTLDFKAHILKIATQDTWIDHKTRPLMNAIKISVYSLYQCYKGEKRNLLYPQL
jgi:CRISPR-associated protein Cas1